MSAQGELRTDGNEREDAVGTIDSAATDAGRWTSTPIVFLLALYMVATSRWGSYIGLPGLPFFVGDVLLVAAGVQVAFVLYRRRSLPGEVLLAPLAALCAIALFVWASLRLVLGLDASLTALRDYAPYAYAIAVLLAIVLPIRDGERYRRLIYGVLTFHAIWVIVLPKLSGFPWSLPSLGTSDAVLLVVRPDFDATVLGVSCAFAVHDLLTRRGSIPPVPRIAIALFAAANLYGTTTMATRAGLLAALVCVACVIGAWVTRLPADSSVDQHHGRRPRWQVFLAVGIFVVLVAAVLPFTPTGQRVIDGFSSSTQSRGTIDVREEVWSTVTDYVFTDAERTAVGVGFGRNFIDESGNRNALEGTVFTNVRSPHNYLVGTVARLGILGAGLAALVLLLGWWMALGALRRHRDPVTSFAALLVIGLPVTALLGVILESPFGALPYFWAIGHLAAREIRAPMSLPHRGT